MSTAASRRAVVLSGGGAYGAYGVGVLEALTSGRWRHGREGPVELSIFTGTSVGAYNAAVLTARADAGSLSAVRQLRRLWLERVASLDGERQNGIYRVRGLAGLNFLAGTTHLRDMVVDTADDLASLARYSLVSGLSFTFSRDSQRRFLRLVNLEPWISTAPFERLIAETLDTTRVVRSRGRHLAVVTTQWDDGESFVFVNREVEGGVRPSTLGAYHVVELTAENANRAIVASASLPGVFEPVGLGGIPFVDGGVLMNTPLAPAILAGAEEIHVVSLAPRLAPMPLGRPPSSYDAIERLSGVLPAHAVDRELHVLHQVAASRRAADGAPRDRFDSVTDLTVHHYYPSRRVGDGFGFLDFRLGRVVELMELGFRDAVEHDCVENGCILGRRDAAETVL